MNFKLEDFTNNGVAFPFKINNSTEDFEGEYFRFQELAQKNFGKKLSLKPNLLSPFFDKLATHPDITTKIKKIIGENIYIWSSAFFAKAPGEGKIVSFSALKRGSFLLFRLISSAFNFNLGKIEISMGPFIDKLYPVCFKTSSYNLDLYVLISKKEGANIIIDKDNPNVTRIV